MLKIDIPDFGAFTIKYLVMDYNGTLAEDGILIIGVDNIFKRIIKTGCCPYYHCGHFRHGSFTLFKNPGRLKATLRS